MSFFKRILLANLLFFSAAFSLGAMQESFLFTKEREICGVQVLIQQFSALDQEDDASCGAHATFNLLGFMRGDKFVEVEQHLNNLNAFEQIINLCYKVNNGIDFSGDESGQVIKKLLYELKKEHEDLHKAIDSVTIIDRKSTETLAFLLDEESDDFEKNTMILSQVVDLQEKLRDKGIGLENLQPQYFLVSSRRGHWFPLKFKCCPSIGKIIIWTADSNSLNLTKVEIIDRILKLMLKEEEESS